MAKKLNKKQKRAKKVQAKRTQRSDFDNVKNQVYVDEKKIAIAFPDINDRLDYIRTLAKDLV